MPCSAEWAVITNRRSAKRIEIHLLAGKVGKTRDLRPHEDVQLGREDLAQAILR